MLNIISRSVYQLNPTGPKKVVSNLIAGLKKANISFVLNKAPLSTGCTLIHDDLTALAYVQTRYKNGEIAAKDFLNKKLIVGPNIAFDPSELERAIPGIMTKEDSILMHATLLCPSAWVKAFWIKRGFTTPISIWPVGVDTVSFDPKHLRSKLNISIDDIAKDLIVYTKGRDQADMDEVVSRLTDQGITYTLLKYGTYTEPELMHAALTHKLALVIVSSESQGIALEELMSLNLPLLVWNISTVNQKSVLAQQKNIDNSYTIGGTESATSVPYFDPRCGLVVDDINDIVPALHNMLHSLEQFAPRDYVLEHLSLDGQARALLSLFDTQTNTDTAQVAHEKHHYKNWRNRTWFLPWLLCKYIIKYIRWKLQ